MIVVIVDINAEVFDPSHANKAKIAAHMRRQGFVGLENGTHFLPRKADQVAAFVVVEDTTPAAADGSFDGVAYVVARHGVITADGDDGECVLDGGRGPSVELWDAGMLVSDPIGGGNFHRKFESDVRAEASGAECPFNVECGVAPVVVIHVR